MADSQTITITVQGNETQYSLSVNIVGSGSVSKNPNQATYPSGTTVTLTASPANGWKFSSWSGDLSGFVNPTNITMSANKSITATFSPTETPPPFPWWILIVAGGVGVTAIVAKKRKKK